MIRVAYSPIDQAALENKYSNGSIEQTIIETMASSQENYDYDSLDQFEFEVKMRAATVNAARRLNRSGMDFAIFRKSKCNPDYWNRTDEGGFELKKGANPSDAIRDIFKNGPEYATECATAIVIVFYKAALDVFPEGLFDKVFSEIYLMNWRHIDPILKNIGLMKQVKDYLPGDRMYFANPDVNPVTPEWQGENVILLDTDSYYGHGIGIHDGKFIVDELNRNRVKNAEESAYRLKTAGQPDYRKLFDICNT
jgi:protein-glutamine gamma-glutamyltransferase